MIKVFHAANTTDDNASNYGFDSWISYWEKKKQNHPGFTCPFCGKFPKKLIGAHVVSCKDWKTYIVPCCSDCNLNPPTDKIGMPLLIDVDDNLLVPHPST